MPSVEEFARLLALAERHAHTAGEVAGSGRTAAPVPAAAEQRVRVGPAGAALTRWLIDTGRARDTAGEAELTVEPPGDPAAADAYLAAYTATLRDRGARVTTH